MRETERDQHIERKIIIGIITNDEFCKKVSQAMQPGCFGASTAWKLALWVQEYFNQFGKAPGKDMEGIYLEKLKQKRISKDDAEDIEDILSDLSDQNNQIAEIDIKYLIYQTEQHFNANYQSTWAAGIKEAAEKCDFALVESLRAEFQPIRLEPEEQNILSAGELWDMEIKGPKWLVRNLLPTGLTIMGGRSKVGKSYFMMNLCLALAQKKPVFADQDFKSQAGQILYLSLEDTPKRFQTRMKEIEQEPNRELLQKNLFPAFEWKKLTKGGLIDIEAWIKNQPNPRCVVVDTVAKVWNKKSGTGGGGLYAEEYAIYGPLAEMAHKHNMSIILVTHTTKTKTTDVFDQILGGMGTQGPADNLVVLANMDRSNKKVFSIRGKDIEEKHLSFEAAGAVWDYIGEAETVQKTSQRQELYNLLLEEGKPLTVKEIKSLVSDMRLSIAQNSVQIVLRKMVAEGQLEQPGHGKYAIAGQTGKIVNINVKRRMGRNLINP